MGQLADLITALKAAHERIQSTHPTLATATTNLDKAHTLFHTTSHGSHNPTAPQTTQALRQAQAEITEAHSLLTQAETLIQQYLTHITGQTPTTTSHNTNTTDTGTDTKTTSKDENLTKQGDVENNASYSEVVPIERYTLPHEENERIFREDIVSMEFGDVVPQELPEAVFIVGQQGAGKTRLTDQFAGEFEQRGGFVNVDSDIYKQYHPAYEDLLCEDDRLMAAYTGPDGREWMTKAQDYAREHQLNVIVQETVQNPEYFAHLAQSYRDMGYRIVISVMGVPEALSRQGILHRYYQQVSDRGHGRLTVPEKAIASYQGIVNGAQLIDELRLADEVAVYRRGESEPRYRNELTADGQWRDAPRLHKAIETERSRPLSDQEIAQFHATQSYLRQVAGPEWDNELAAIESLAAPLLAPKRDNQ